MIGRKGRLVNHSCEPNCKVEIRTVDNERVVLVAKQKIGIGVEITFNTISYSSTEYQTMLILCIYLFCGMSITVHSTKITKAHIIYGAKIILWQRYPCTAATHTHRRHSTVRVFINYLQIYILESRIQNCGI